MYRRGHQSIAASCPKGEEGHDEGGRKGREGLGLGAARDGKVLERVVVLALLLTDQPPEVYVGKVGGGRWLG